jgi:beta-galactosidase
MGEKRLEFPAQGTSGGWNSYALPVVNPTTNDLHLVWDVPYEPGVLRAVGKRRDRAVCNDEVRTTGAPSAIRLVADHDTIADRRGDVAHVAFEIVDAAGSVVPTAGDLVRVTVSGGDLLTLDNADLQDQSGYRTGQRRAFNGRGVAIVRATKPGLLRVDASADGLRSASVTLRVVPGRATPIVPAAR